MSDMARVRVCGTCGAPRRVTRDQVWLDNGTIVARKQPTHRMIFIESDNITHVFEIMQEILGVSLEHIVIESQRKATRDYVDHLMPEIAKRLMRTISYRPMVRSLTQLGKTLGLGDVSLIDMHVRGGEGDYVKLGIGDAFFLPAFCGMVAASMEVVTGHECSVSYRETSPGYYEVTTYVSTLPSDMEERFRWREYSRKPGDMDLERCPGCGGPRALSNYDFRYDSGVILNKNSGRRMIIDGPAEFEAILDELEKELGEEIPQVIMEAQRRFVKSGFYDLDEVKDMGMFRDHLALRGFGNLREISLDENGLRLHLENPCLHLLLAGMAQGLFELASGREAEMEWELADDGDLKIDIAAKDR